MLFRWCHQHLIYSTDGRSISIQADQLMIVPLMLNVKKCVEADVINHVT